MLIYCELEHVIVLNLDARLFHELNEKVGTWPLLDRLIHAVTDDFFLRGSVIFFLFWVCWFIDPSIRKRSILLCGLVATCIATLLSVAIQQHLLIHVRPLLDPDLSKHLSEFVDMSLWVTPDSLAHPNSFPSDTATMYFALAIAIAYNNWRFGSVAMVWTLFVIALPRIYLAYHYPSDIAGGMVLALVIQTVLIGIQPIRKTAERVLLAFEGRDYLLHSLLFLFVMDMANLFEGIRHALRSISLVAGILH